MPTKLTKDITRQTLAVTTRRNEPVIVTLKAGDLLEFRVKGKRIRNQVSLAHCFRLAEVLNVENEYTERRRIWKDKKDLAKKLKQPFRLREPKRQNIPASQFYFNATKN